MKRCMAFSLALSAVLGMATMAWSQAGGAGGGGAGGGGGTGGATGGGSAAGAGGPTGAGATGTGTSQAATAPGAAGAVNTGGTVGTSQTGGTGNVGVVGSTGRPPTVGQNPASNAPGFGTSGGVNQSAFFNDPGARQQLNLNDNQFNSLNQAYKNAYGQYNQAVNNINANQNLTPQQRAAQLQNLENQFNNNFNRTVDSTFTDPRSRSRYDQLYRQYQGFNAFNDQAVQRQMNLTPQQLVQLRQMSAAWRQQMNQLRQGNGANQNITPEQWSQMYSQYYDQLNGVLTPQQQQLWNQQIGQRYTFSPNVYFSTNGAGSGRAINGRPGAANRNLPPGTDIPHGNAPGAVQPNPNTSNGAGAPGANGASGAGSSNGTTGTTGSSSGTGTNR